MNNQTYPNVRAVYHEGVLTVLDPLPLPDGTRFSLMFTYRSSNLLVKTLATIQRC